MNNTIYEQLQRYGLELITFAGKINPYAGAAIALFIAFALIWFGIKAKSERTEEEKKKVEEHVGTGTGQDQKTIDDENKKSDDFLK